MEEFDYEKIRHEVFTMGQPFRKMAEFIVYPMYRRVQKAVWKKKLPECITITEEYEIEYSFSKAMQNEREIPPLLDECKALIGKV